MEPQWSGKKVLSIWLAIIALFAGVIGFFHYFPQYANHTVLVIVGDVMTGVIIVVGLSILGLAEFPKAIVLTIKQVRNKRQAKSEAYFMILSGRIYDYDRLEEICKILTPPATLGMIEKQNFYCGSFKV